MLYVRNILLWLMVVSCTQAAEIDSPAKVPTGYLYKVEPGIPGRIVYVCGQRPFNDSGSLIGSGDLAAQARQVFENIKTSLATVNMSLKDITQITYSIKETSGAPQVSAVKSQAVKAMQTAYFPQTPQIVEVKGVPQTVREDVLIEVEVIAVK